MARILVAGLNPAWQQIFTLPSLHAGAVNRAAGFVELASGKGMNAAKILAARGHTVSLLQVLAGERGERVRSACVGRGIRSLHVFVPGETRVCATLLNGNETTEVIAPFTVSDPDLSKKLFAQIPDEKFDALLVCGTVPAGMREDEVGMLAARVAAPLTIWDSVAGLSADALSRVTWLKVNAEEYRTLAPRLATSGARPALLITDGPRPAIVGLPDAGSESGVETEACFVPPLDKVVNPIGAGDTVTAVLADGLLSGLAPRAAVSKALAAAAASCLDVLPAVWDPEVAERLETQIEWAPA